VFIVVVSVGKSWCFESLAHLSFLELGGVILLVQRAYIIFSRGYRFLYGEV